MDDFGSHCPPPHKEGTEEVGAIDVERNRFPYAIVWSPLPLITWFLPFIGHMGICDSRGVIYDFAGPYFIGEDHMVRQPRGEGDGLPTRLGDALAFWPCRHGALAPPPPGPRERLGRPSDHVALAMCACAAPISSNLSVTHPCRPPRAHTSPAGTAHRAWACTMHFLIALLLQAFGAPTRYLTLDPSKVRATKWNSAIDVGNAVCASSRPRAVPCCRGSLCTWWRAV